MMGASVRRHPEQNSCSGARDLPCQGNLEEVPRPPGKSAGFRDDRKIKAAITVTWRTPMHDNPGRVAGLWYLLIVLMGPLRLIYIPSKLFVKGNASATVSNIASHQFLLRTGIVSDLIASVALVLLVFAFYGLLRGVDPGLAVQVVIFGGIMPALLSLVGVVYDMAALTIAQGVD